MAMESAREQVSELAHSARLWLEQDTWAAASVVWPAPCERALALR